MIKSLVGRIKQIVNTIDSQKQPKILENDVATIWANRPSQESDIFLVSYPRSGNTWLRYLMTNLRFPEARWRLQSLAFAFPEIGSSIDPSSVPLPRWIKSHLPYTSAYSKVIYLIRDGRDVAVSFYYWSGLDKTEKFSDFVKDRIIPVSQESGIFGGWQHHVNGWLDHQTEENMLLIKYKNLINSPITTIKQILEFVDLDRSEREIEVAIERSTFDVLQRDYQQYEPFKHFKVGVKGGPGKWKEFFDDELHEYYWKMAGDAMKRAGYERADN